MSRGVSRGQAQTVLGPVAPENLGIIMMHEHLLVDLRQVFDEPEDPADRTKGAEPVRLENLSWVLRNWCSSLDNLLLDDLDLAVDEANAFKQAGGGTLVDVTSIGLGRDPLALCRIAERTGLHVVMGCSYYTAHFHPSDMDARSEDSILDEIVSDISVGVGDTQVRAGIIGEVGCTWPLAQNEVKVLRASARAQRETGAAISIHPGLNVDAPFEILDILADSGADIERVIMGHMERTGLDDEQLLRLAGTGCYLEFDWFGQVLPTYPHGRVDVPSDGERIKSIAFLISEGHGKKIVVSQDVCMKMRLASYGGPGYAHFARYVRKWMSESRIRVDAIDDLVLGNPARILQFA